MSQPPWLSSCSEAKGGWLPLLSDRPPRQFIHSGGTSFCTVCVGSFQLSTQAAHRHVNFSLLCSLLQTFYSCLQHTEDFQLLKQAGSQGFQSSINEKPALKSLRPAGHRMANKHSCISLPALFFLLGYI